METGIVYYGRSGWLGAAAGFMVFVYMGSTFPERTRLIRSSAYVDLNGGNLLKRQQDLATVLGSSLGLQREQE